jgi:cation diffusion facilitator CzcD-associated flavoprotein CzcO
MLHDADSSEPHHDVAIIGGGPAGLLAARALLAVMPGADIKVGGKEGRGSGRGSVRLTPAPHVYLDTSRLACMHAIVALVPCYVFGGLSRER